MLYVRVKIRGVPKMVKTSVEIPISVDQMIRLLNTPGIAATDSTQAHRPYLTTRGTGADRRGYIVFPNAEARTLWLLRNSEHL